MLKKSVFLFFLVLYLGGLFFPFAGYGEVGENIILSTNNGVLEKYGSQHNSYPASRVHDAATNRFWLSQQNNYKNYFIFSFEAEAE